MRRPVTAALVMALVAAPPAGAQLVTSSSPFFTNTIDLSPFSNGFYNFTFGPVLIQSGVTFIADPIFGGNSTLGSVIGQGSYGFGSNGHWDETLTYIGLDASTGFMRILFGSPVGGVGGFMNYEPSGDVFIRALAGDLSVLASYNLATDAPISTPGGLNAGAFRGIVRDANDIWGFEVANQYIAVTNLQYGLNGIDTTVPEPSTIVLLASGLAGIGLVSWRRRKRSL